MVPSTGQIPVNSAASAEATKTIPTPPSAKEANREARANPVNQDAPASREAALNKLTMGRTPDRVRWQLKPLERLRFMRIARHGD